MCEWATRIGVDDIHYMLIARCPTMVCHRHSSISTIYRLPNDRAVLGAGHVLAVCWRYVRSIAEYWMAAWNWASSDEFMDLCITGRANARMNHCYSCAANTRMRCVTEFCHSIEIYALLGCWVAVKMRGISNSNDKDARNESGKFYYSWNWCTYCIVLQYLLPITIALKMNE